MTLRERIALGAACVGFVLVVAGAARFGWWAACVVAGVLLIAASVGLGTGDPAELLPVDDELVPVDPADEEFHIYEIRGTDDAGQGPGGGGR